MQVKLRLQRFGTKKRPFYRIVAAMSTSKRDGRFLEILGLYHPVAAENQQVRLEKDKLEKWLKNGAQPTKQIRSILSDAGIWKEHAAQKEQRKIAKIKKLNQKKKEKKKAS